MSPSAIFRLQFVLSLVVGTLVARWYVWPRLTALPLRSGLIPLLLVHATRYVGLVFLEHAPPTVKPAVLAATGTLERSEGARTVIVGYGTTTPRRASGLPLDASTWDGKRRVRSSALRRVVDETWGLWSIPSYVCSGDSGGGIFLTDRLVANVSDGGQDCRRHNNNNRLDTRAIQQWIDGAVKANQKP